MDKGLKFDTNIKRFPLKSLHPLMITFNWKMFGF